MGNKPICLMSKELFGLTLMLEDLTTIDVFAAVAYTKTPFNVLPAMAVVCALLWQALSVVV